MYITEVPTKTKSGKISHRCILLRESYRQDGRVKNRTLANLTHCDPAEVAAMRLALVHKGDLDALGCVSDVLEVKQGRSVGAGWLVYDLARRLGLEKALGSSRSGKLALWQVMARVIEQGSRLSAVRLASEHAGCDILGLRQGFNEEHLYRNLGWLADNQLSIEQRLFGARHRTTTKPQLFLYDVTSSYLEGEHNELAAWGYNRDGKRGKQQVVVGLLCDEQGEPVSVEVFTGNTTDAATFSSQLQKASQAFGVEKVTFVGDRGMIKSGQIKDLQGVNFHYITAITKAQIDKLLKTGVFQLGLFEHTLCEVEHDGVRYIFRRNPVRATEMAHTREEKKAAVEKLCRKKNSYLAEHPRARLAVAERDVKDKIKGLKLAGWLKVIVREGRLQLAENKEALAEEAKLDGCYCIKSDLPKEVDKQVVHDRYRDLALVEQAFRTSKTTLLELRPWYVQTERSTRGHALVVMLAYLITHKLQQAWAGLDLTVAEGLELLSRLCSTQVIIKGGGSCHRIPTPNRTTAELLQAAGVCLPQTLPHLGAIVVSRKKLASRRRNP